MKDPCTIYSNHKLVYAHPRPTGCPIATSRGLPAELGHPSTSYFFRRDRHSRCQIAYYIQQVASNINISLRLSLKINKEIRTRCINNIQRNKAPPPQKKEHLSPRRHRIPGGRGLKKGTRAPNWGQFTLMSGAEAQSTSPPHLR